MSAIRLARRHGYDGWGLLVRGSPKVLPWSLSTTRAEARAELRLAKQEGLLRGLQVDVVPVRVLLVGHVAGPTHRRSRKQPS